MHFCKNIVRRLWPYEGIWVRKLILNRIIIFKLLNLFQIVITNSVRFQKDWWTICSMTFISKVKWCSQNWWTTLAKFAICSDSCHIFKRDRYKYAINPIIHSSSVKTKITVLCRWYCAMGHRIWYLCCKTYVKNGRFATFEMIIKTYYGLTSRKRWSEAIFCIVTEPNSHGKHSFRISLQITEDWSLENICIIKDNFQIFEEKIVKESLAISHGTPIWPHQNYIKYFMTEWYDPYNILVLFFITFSNDETIVNLSWCVSHILDHF